MAPEQRKRNVYEVINAVITHFADHPIRKAQQNAQQGFRYRGIDDVYNGLSKAMSEQGLVVMPRCLSREVSERTNRSGTALFFVTVDMEFDFVSVHDGSRHTVRMFGEAMDSGDKATNKAMSVAYKYAALQTFCIPTEGDNDPDAHTHEVKPAAKAQRAPARKPQEKAQDDTQDAPLTAEQIKHIRSLAQSVGKPIEDIARAHRKEALDLIQQRHYEPIIRRLNEYKAKQDA